MSAEKFAVVAPSIYGPYVSFYRSMDGVASLLMAWARVGVNCKADTVWKMGKEGWVPAFPWQHAEKVSA